MIREPALRVANECWGRRAGTSLIMGVVKMVMGVVRNLVRWIPLRRRAQWVARLVPRSSWYRVALSASRVQARITARMGGNGELTEAVMLDHWLHELTLCGAFPIPWRRADVSALERVDGKTGVLYCWTHVPLSDMPLRAFLEMGHEAPWAVAEEGNIVERGEFIVPGLAQRVRAIAADRYMLLKMRTVLRRGGSVAYMADPELGGPISGRALRLVGRLGARVIFQWAERREDGVIDIWFVDAPQPFCESDEAIEENLEFLRVANRRVLGALGVRASEAVDAS